MNSNNAIGLENREEVLKSALILERLASFFLASLLGVKDYTKSRTLGNKSGCLSFNQKIDMLVDIGALSSEKRNKFQKFMEIRNQFMHNIDASTFEKCVSGIDGAEKFLLKNYPQDNSLTKEEILRVAVYELSKEITELTISITKKIKEKRQSDINNKILKLATKTFSETVNQMHCEFEAVAKNLKNGTSREKTWHLIDNFKLVFYEKFNRIYSEINTDNATEKNR